KGDRVAAILQREQGHFFRRNRLRAHLILMRFRYIPVLAKETPHVAAGRAHAEHARARQKMIQRLFFDGVDLQRGWRSITEVVELAVLIDADKAESRLAGMNVAMPGAKKAVHAPVAFRLPPARFVQGFGLLEDRQIAHDPPPADSILPANVPRAHCWKRVANRWIRAAASGVAPLHTAAFGGPVGESLQLVAVLPCQLEK